MSKLPSFLDVLDKQLPGQPSTQPAHYINAVFRHKRLCSLSHALWWPSLNDSKSCVMFITGNPGLLDFYTPFLTAIHEKAAGQVNILGHALIGHTPGIEYPKDGTTATCLSAQVEGVLDIVEAVKSQYDKLSIMAHSVGSWLTLQVLKARPELVHSVILLFPTICHMTETPNGLKLTRLFKWPFPSILRWLSYALRLVPMQVIYTMYGDWPTSQCQVLRGFLSSPFSIYNALTLADDEMKTITDLDVQLLQQHSHRIHLYFGESDDWVGKYRETIMQAFEADEDNVKIARGHPDIPHSFCINHGEQVAEQCYAWLHVGNVI
ncbi:hypothetical protein BC835DRAFT_1418198 [Cytidiella melzeri]|nr:hypothetical protein BC835DRAFT_1418198 [Cytidiella melzeri]